MENFNPVIWFEIYVEDMDRAAKFYETVFDLKLESIPNPTDDPMEMRTFPGDMKIHGSNGALVKMDGFDVGKNSTIVYFASKDCITEENRIEKAGGKVFKPKMQIGEHGFITMFTDSEGNMVGLHSME